MGVELGNEAGFLVVLKAGRGSALSGLDEFVSVFAAGDREHGLALRLADHPSEALVQQSDRDGPVAQF